MAKIATEDALTGLYFVEDRDEPGVVVARVRDGAYLVRRGKAPMRVVPVENMLTWQFFESVDEWAHWAGARTAASCS